MAQIVAQETYVLGYVIYTESKGPLSPLFKGRPFPPIFAVIWFNNFFFFFWGDNEIIFNGIL